MAQSTWSKYSGMAVGFVGLQGLDPERPEHQRLRSWVHHHPKAEAPVREGRAAPVSIRTPHVSSEVVERAAPQYTGCVALPREFFILCPLSETCWVGIMSPDATRPLPYVPSHIQQPIRTSSFGIGPYGCRIALVTFFGIAARGIPVVTPRVDASIRAPSRLFSLSLAGQTV